MPNNDEEQDSGYRKPKWQKQTARQQMDRRLESAGLLNYQTKNLSQAEIANRYAQAGIRVNANWYKQNYGDDQPAQRQQPTGGSNWSEGQANPEAPAPQPINVGRASKGWDPGKTNKYFYQTDPNTGLATKMRATSADSRAVQAGQANWTDVFVAERKRILSDPNFYRTNQIEKYPAYAQQQILTDPAFKFDQLPDWQKPFYDISSNPKIMASPMAIAGMHAGSGFGIVGKAVGAIAGYAVGIAGGQEFNPAGNLKQQPTKAAQVMYLLNELAQFSEQAVGYASTVATMYTQSPETVAKNKRWMSEAENRQALWDASMTAWDYSIGGELRNVMPGIELGWEILKDMPKAGETLLQIIEHRKGMPLAQRIEEEKKNPMVGLLAEALDPKLKFAAPGQDFIIGAGAPVEVGGTAPGLNGEALNTSEMLIKEARYIRSEIGKGRNANDVVNEVIMRAQQTVGGQVGDFVGQAKFDPLEILPKVETGIVRKGAELAGNKPLAEAFTGVDTPREGLQKYKVLVQTGEAAKLDPNFNAQKLSPLGKWMAGLNQRGEIKTGSLLPTNKGLLDADPKKPTGGLFEETPQSRAQTGASMFDRNIGTLLHMFNDPREAAGYLRRIASGDMTAWAEMGSALGNSPEWYTILPALKDYTGEKLTALAEAWELTATNRDALNRMAEVLGVDPTKLIDDWAARNTLAQDLETIKRKATETNTPASRAILADIASGAINADTLKQIVDIFHGEGAIPHNEAQWKWAMYADMSDHFAEWVATHLQLDKSPEAQSAFFQTMGILKQAQSLVLLGLSPGYAITNGLSGIVHLAATGVYGSMTPKQMNDWIARWETPVPRLDEGVGIGGLVDTAKSTAISDAVKGKGPLTTIKQTLSKLQRGMPMSKLSSKFESVNSKRGYVTGIRQFWSRSWRRGVGFRKMEPALVAILREAGINPDHIYAAIEAGVNQSDIERALTSQYKGQKAAALINDAAVMANMTPADAADMMDKIGLTDVLNTFLAGADTPTKVDVAFKRAEDAAQRWIDMRAGEELAGRAEEVKNIVGKEGVAAGLKIAQQNSDQFFWAWFDHYERFGDIMGSIDGLDGRMADIAIEEAYRQSDDSFRRVFANMATNYKGIFDAWGLSGNPDALNALHAISDMNNSMKNAYDFMRKTMREMKSKAAAEGRRPTGQEWSDAQSKIDKAFTQAFKEKKAAYFRMGEALGKVYTQLYGENAGKAARLWWSDISKFTEKIEADEKRFRDEIKAARDMGADPADIQEAKRKYYSENKMVLIADLQQINDNGIKRLEAIISGRSVAANGQPTKPTKAQERAAEKARIEQEKLNELLAGVEQIDAEEQKARAERENAVWQVAAQFGYDKSSTANGFHALLGAIKKEEYGGLPVRDLSDPRLTPEVVTAILEKRKAIKEAEAANRTPPSIKELKKAKKKKPKDMTILLDIIAHGGLNAERMGDVGADPAMKYTKGLFTNRTFDTGWDITDMARRLADDGYAIDLNDPDDPGGVKQTTELIRRAMAGESIHPVGYDPVAGNEKAIAAAEAAHYEALAADEKLEALKDFDPAAWRAEMQKAADAMNLDAIAELMGQIPSRLTNEPMDSGETFGQYSEQLFDNTFARVTADDQATTIAEAKVDADAAIAKQTARADAAMTRQLMLEKWTEIFGAEKAQAYMEMSDAVAQWYAKQTGEDPENFYARYYEDARAEESADWLGDLKQAYGRIEGGADRELTGADLENYARMLSRDENNARYMIRNEADKAIRVALIEEIQKINPDMADRIARSEWQAFMQEQKRQVFYSKLIQTVENIKAEKMTADQLRGMVKGEKADEIKWMGLETFLRGKTDVTKTDVLEFLKANQIEIGETVLGGIPRAQETQDTAMSRAQENRTWSKHIEKIERAGFQLAPSDPMMIEDGTVDGSEMFFIDQYGDIIDASDPQLKELGVSASADSIVKIYKYEYDVARRAGEHGRYSQYVLPGGENYREVLFTLPDQQGLPERALARAGLTLVKDGVNRRAVDKDGVIVNAQDATIIHPGRTATDAEQAALIETRYIDANVTNYQSTHWKGTPNVLAHTRLTDRIDADGKRVLFVEEIQSDWHQAGRDKGYKDPQAEKIYNDLTQRLAALQEENNALGTRASRRLREWQTSDEATTVTIKAEDGVTVLYEGTDGKEAFLIQRENKGSYEDYDAARKQPADVTEMQQLYQQQYREIEKLKAQIAETPQGKVEADMQRFYNGKGRMSDAEWTALSERVKQHHEAQNAVPDAPFKKNWHELVMKRVLRMAAEGGYDRVAWTTGEQQAARYNLAQQVDSVQTARIQGQDLYDVRALAKNNPNEILMRENLTAAQLPGALGKELADKIINSPDGTHNWKGVDLKVGGEGMKGFYDKMLPAFIDKYAKQWGAKSGEVRLPDGSVRRAEAYDPDTGELRYWSLDGETIEKFKADMLRRGFAEGELRYDYNQPEGGTPVHSIDVTDSMRESVMNGQPLFQGKQEGASGTIKGAVTFDADGMRATIHAFRSADFSTLIHENAHVYRRVLKDVAERTGNKQVVADLATIEEWAGVKDGNWTVPAEEKFARAFEKYIRGGEAPTPKLKAAFETFRKWMVEIYKTIIGSDIESAYLSQEVKDVFDRMLGAEAPTEPTTPKRDNALLQRTKQEIADPTNTPAFKNWFKDSKVVDKEGKPLVVFHSGTFDENVDPIPQINGAGFHFGTENAAIDRQRGKYTEAIFLDEQDGRWTWENPMTGQSSLDLDQDFPTEYQAYKDGVKAVDEALSQMDAMPVTKAYISIQNMKRVPDMQEAGKWNEAIAQAKKEGYDGIVYTNQFEDKGSDSYIVFKPSQIKSVNNRGTYKGNNVLWQEANAPIGTVEEAGQQPPHAQAMAEGYEQQVRPLMEAMRQVARDRIQQPLDGATRDLSPEGQAMLKKYTQQVKADMASTKNAATKWGESQRDFAMLNYNKRYGIDRYIETVYPYQFFYTRSLATWAARALDKPAIFSQYARLKRQQDRYERDIPERLRGKIKIPMPWLPDWMGDALYIDPIKNLFTPLNFMRPFERIIQDNTYQQIEAERILQEWAADGTVGQTDIVEAIKTREGATWERAFAEAQIRRESEINTPFDFLSTMFGPAWYLTTPLKLAGVTTFPGAEGGKETISSTPILNTTRALDTVTQGTWAEPFGDIIGLLGKPEEMLRNKLGLPEFGEYGDYYIDRQLANMVADGTITSDEAQQSMIERAGPTFEEARERVKMELAMRVPTASALLVGLTAENFGQGIARAAMSSPASLFGAGLLPAGELEYRGLKQEWNEAWKMKDVGDDQAITKFFDDHPEYEAYLSKGKSPEDRLRGYLVGQIWDGYMALGTTDRKMATAEMGDAFQRDFLSTETRSIETLDIETLARWAQMLNQTVPQTQATAPALAAPSQPVRQFDPAIAKITDKFFADRTRMFPDYYVVQNGYYNIPETDRSGRYKYLAQHPELKQYWDWKKAYENRYPDLVPIMKGQVFKRIDTSAWPPALLDYVIVYAYTGEKLPKGAYKALKQVWLAEGQPYGDMDAWLASEVAPALLYGGQP